jgi:hypothetical protein
VRLAGKPYASASSNTELAFSSQTWIPAASNTQTPEKPCVPHQSAESPVTLTGNAHTANGVSHVTIAAKLMKYNDKKFRS